MTHPRPAAAAILTVTSIEEGQTVVRAQRGDGDAREELACFCLRQAFLFALQLTGNREEARDVAQDAMVRFFGALARFDASRPVRPWLMRIVRNLVRDRRRRSRVRRTETLATTEGALLLEPADPGPDPEQDAARRQMQRLLWSALHQLSDQHREIVALRDYLDLSYDEIATALDIPRGTVMSRLHRARAQLRAAVQQELRQGEQRGEEVPHG